MTIGDRIKKQRELLGISQVELAEKMKVSKQTLYNDNRR
nr:MAG TPA: helix-turn-helix domain protein [Caudoviricetes sp.]